MESLIPVDISPINSKEVSDIQSVIDVLRGVNLEVNGPISKVRKLADEHMKSSIEVCYVITYKYNQSVLLSSNNYYLSL